MVLLWLSRVRLFVTPRTAARQASLSFTTSQSLLKLMFNKSVMPSNHLILCCLLLLTVSRHTTDMVVLHHRHGRSTPSNRQALAPPTRKPAQTLDQPHPQEARLCSHSLQNKSGQHRPDPALGPAARLWEPVLPAHSLALAPGSGSTCQWVGHSPSTFGPRTPSTLSQS